MSPYLFLGSEGFPPTVYDAQVADHLRVLAREGLVFDVVNFDPLYPRTIASREGRAKVERFRQALPGRLTVLPFIPYEDRVGSPLATLQLRTVLAGRGPGVIHARGLQAADLAVRAASARSDIRIVYDVRGDYWAEHRFHWTGRGDDHAAGIERLQRTEAAVCAGVDRVFTVSGALRDVLEARHPGVAAKTHVFPCTFDPTKFRLDAQARASWRARLGVGERRLVAYTGSLVAYQLPGQLVALGARLAAGRDDVFFALVTPNLELGQALLDDAGLGPRRATALRVEHDEMPGLLNAIDMGLLLRRPDPVNAVASPTKLAEYLACGAGVLISDGIGDLSQLVRERKVGRVVSTVDDMDALEAAAVELLADPPTREHAAQVASEALARDRYLPDYASIYRELAAPRG